MIFEGKTSDNPEKLKDILKVFFKTFGIQKEDQNPKLWAIYINQRLTDELNKIIRPRSHYAIFNRKSKKPKIDIIHQDSHWIVLNKPSGLSTQKTLKSDDENLYDQLRLFLAIKMDFPPREPYVGLHHRLDRETSGLVLMSLKREVNKEISDLFLHKQIKKEYMAKVSYGDKKPPPKWTTKNRLVPARNSTHPFYFKVSDDQKGDEAITHFKYIESSPDKTYHSLLCQPVTGRTHQLRVHLSHLGWPILGDPVYGNPSSAPRMMLHSQSLKFELKGKEYEIKSLPDWD